MSLIVSVEQLSSSDVKACVLKPGDKSDTQRNARPWRRGECVSRIACITSTPPLAWQVRREINGVFLLS